jgi:hypothetical protein
MNWAKLGDVLQINPEHDKLYGGCFFIVTEIKEEFVSGFIKLGGGKEVSYMCQPNMGDFIGSAVWMPEELKNAIETINKKQEETGIDRDAEDSSEQIQTNSGETVRNGL